MFSILAYGLFWAVPENLVPSKTQAPKHILYDALIMNSTGFGFWRGFRRRSDSLKRKPTAWSFLRPCIPKIRIVNVETGEIEVADFMEHSIDETLKLFDQEKELLGKVGSFSQDIDEYLAARPNGKAPEITGSAVNLGLRFLF